LFNFRVNKQCDTFIPKIGEIAYERLIDNKDSYYKYASKSLLQMFSTATLAQTYDNPEVIDLEVTHPQSNLN
jgi:hypothetical protein